MSQVKQMFDEIAGGSTGGGGFGEGPTTHVDCPHLKYNPTLSAVLPLLVLSVTPLNSAKS